MSDSSSQTSGVGPNLVYRTFKDVFTPPSGPAQDVRTVELLDVDHEKLSKNNLWSQQIRFTSVDFIRFRWVEEDGKSPQKTVTSRPTVWVGVLPDSTTGDAAFHSAQEILQLLKNYSIDDIDVAYRESTAQFLANSPLLAPFNNLSPLKDVADWITTLGEFVALLTGGTGPTNSPDITYGTLMVWLWEIIKAEFPDANLYFKIAED
ncbi:hypothetical protein K488DRAFT_84664 [Vararia minispora EC-137]|uniref:Uncharacterized protein n=1 Tax=Vararia minispora EC-137 TaxID=1314806 RepID=A0ACB8QQ71_9AGAM|nr:hypothetical protein K488DRAFT_84664 [Vararia minispora EC-137]